MSLGLALCACTPPASMVFEETQPAAGRVGTPLQVFFTVSDAKGEPLEGVTVNLALEKPVAGVVLSSPTATSQSGGRLVAVLQASSSSDPVVVVATVGSVTASSPPLWFADRTPSAKHFTLQCEDAVSGSPRHAVRAYDEARTLISGAQLPCVARLADRAGVVAKGSVVHFAAEAGSLGSDDTVATGAEGRVTVVHTTGLPLPQDTDPGRYTSVVSTDLLHTGEPLAPAWMQPSLWVANPLQYPRAAAPNGQEPARFDPARKKADGSSTLNKPRDNLVTLLAYARGEEGFQDDNGNGAWDVNEPFQDLTEPFVDSNDNGTWDQGELFVDVNGNARWDGKNGTWDGDTLIWAQERVLWTGRPMAPYDTTGPGATIKSLIPSEDLALVCPSYTNPGGPCAVASDAYSGAEQVFGLIYFADPWFNSPAESGALDGCTADVGSSSPVRASVQRPAPGPRLAFPIGDFVSVAISDARKGATGTVPGKRVPALVFQVHVTCRFTSAPLQGVAETWDLGFIAGTVE